MMSQIFQSLICLTGNNVNCWVKQVQQLKLNSYSLKYQSSKDKDIRKKSFVINAHLLNQNGFLSPRPIPLFSLICWATARGKNGLLAPNTMLTPEVLLAPPSPVIFPAFSPINDFPGVSNLGFEDSSSELESSPS